MYSILSRNQLLFVRFRELFLGRNLCLEVCLQLSLDFKCDVIAFADYLLSINSLELKEKISKETILQLCSDLEEICVPSAVQGIARILSVASSLWNISIPLERASSLMKGISPVSHRYGYLMQTHPEFLQFFCRLLRTMPRCRQQSIINGTLQMDNR
jgi:hypothetical protein